VFAYHICRAWYNGSYTMVTKPIKFLELHYTVTQLLIIVEIQSNLPILHWAYAAALTRCAYCMCFLWHGINEDVCDHCSYEHHVTLNPSQFAQLRSLAPIFQIRRL